MKTFNYFGQSVTVPDYAKFIATDPDGQMWWFVNKPMQSIRWFGGGSNCGMCGTNPNIKNWRRSLREC